MAEQLGEAVLKLTLDTSAFQQQLDRAKAQIETELGGAIGGTGTAGARRSRRTTRGVAVPDIGVDERDLVRRFNLRGVVRTLETFSTELGQIQTGRALNIGSNWTRALQTLTEISEGLTQVAAGSKINLNTSWGQALTTLSAIDADLKSVSAGKKLNLNTSWAAALQTLSEIDTDLRTLTLGRQINLRASWNSALRALTEIDTDLKAVAAGKKLNIDSNWSLALRQLTEIDTDLRTVAAGKKLNLRNSWNKFFQDAEQVRTDIAKAGEDARKKAATQRNRLTKDVAANALIGVGFPLLFGQGAGAALGGGLGGAAGAFGGGTFGFAGSIAGTAIGAAFDTAIQKAQQLAQALENPVKNFDKVKEAALLSSKAVERNVESLLNAGRIEEANAAIRADIDATFGDLSSAKAYAQAVDGLNRSWTQLSVVVATFTAGPLTQFINRLKEGIQAVTQLTPEERTAARRRAEAVVASQTTPLQRTGFAGGVNVNFEGKAFSGTAVGVVEDVTAAIEQQLLARKRANIEDRVAVKSANEIQSASARTVNIKKLENQLIVAQAQGNAKLTADLERQLAIQTAEVRIAADKTQELAVRRDLQKELIRIDEQELQRRRDEQAAIRLSTASMMEGIKAARTRVNVANELANTEKGIARQTKQQILQIASGIQAAQAQLRTAEISLETAVDAGATETVLDDLAGKVVVASEELKAAFAEGRLATKEVRENLEKSAKELKSTSASLQLAGLNAQSGLRSAITGFTATRSDPSGLNRFLSPRRATERALSDFQLLLPQFRTAQAQFEQLTGARAREFRGPTDIVNAQIRDFIDAVDREMGAATNVVQAQIDLTKANQDLAEVNRELAAATRLLTTKEWAIAVNVVNQAGGASTVQTLNGLAQ